MRKRNGVSVRGEKRIAVETETFLLLHLRIHVRPSSHQQQSFRRASAWPRGQLPLERAIKRLSCCNPPPDLDHYSVPAEEPTGEAVGQSPF